MKIGISCHHTYGGSGAVATELGKVDSLAAEKVLDDIVDQDIEKKINVSAATHEEPGA